MNLSDQILKGTKCPYCFMNTEYIDSSFVYGRSYGMIYICKPCDAYVGVHKGTNNALGRLANKELREAKKEAHASFDLLWKLKYMTRHEAYKYLADSLNIDVSFCHIGMMDVKLCNKVVEISNKYLNENQSIKRNSKALS